MPQLHKLRSDPWPGNVIGHEAAEKEKKKKRKTTTTKRKVEVKLFFADDMILDRKPQRIHEKTARSNKRIQRCRIQDEHTKNQLCFYIPAVNNLKRKLRKLFHLRQHPRVPVMVQ